MQVVSSYKYLGILLDEHLDYKVTADMIAKSAGHALVLNNCKIQVNGLPTF